MPQNSVSKCFQEFPGSKLVLESLSIAQAGPARTVQNVGNDDKDRLSQTRCVA